MDFNELTLIKVEPDVAAPVRSGHVRGLTPDLTELDRSAQRTPRGAVVAKRPTGRSSHVRGLTPGMSRRDTAWTSTSSH
jgi:hypothetical protein